MPPSFLCEFLGVWHTTRGRNFLAHTYSRCHLSFNWSTPFNTSLFKYFQTNLLLPKPDGPLQMFFLSSSIIAVNKQTWREDTRTLTSKSRTYYEGFTPEEKAQIRKWAVEYGVTVSVHHFSYQSITEWNYRVRVGAQSTSLFFVHSLDQMVMVHGKCTTLHKCVRMHAMSMVTPMQIG